MTETKTPFTTIRGFIENPPKFQACSHCLVEFPIGHGQHYFNAANSGGPYDGWCIFCVREELAPKLALETPIDIAPLEGETKCAVCGHNFKFNLNNFPKPSKYRHPSGKLPCCRLCQGTERREHFRNLMLHYQDDREELAAIAATELSNPAEASELKKARELRLYRLSESSAQNQAYQTYLRHKHDFERSANVTLTDEEWNHVKSLDMLAWRQWMANRHNPKPQQTQEPPK
jgi:hypothetical protein